MPRHGNNDPAVAQRRSMTDLALAGPINAPANAAVESRAGLLRWTGVALVVALVYAGIWWGARAAYFPADVRDGTSQCDEFIAIEGRATMDWIIASAPVWARDALLAAFGWWAFRKAGGVEGQCLTTAIIGGGVGADDGAAGAAGWLAIVGGHESRRAQPT